MPAGHLRRSSFEREALVHLDALYGAAVLLTGSRADADDLVHATMLRAYQAWNQSDRGANVKSWLLAILRHAFINERGRGWGETTDAVFEGPRESHPKAILDCLVDDDVVRAIAELPVAYREVFVFTVEGLRYEESAKIVTAPVDAVKSRLLRARKLLQERLRWART